MSRRFKSFLRFSARFLALLCSVCLGLHGLAAAPPLRVGMELAYPPFEMRDENGRPVGVSVDLAYAIGERLHRPVEIVSLPFDGLIPALKTGKIDLILSSMTVTPERSQAIDFSVPYLRTGLCLLVGVKSGVTSIADANRPGRRIVVKKGTTGHLYAAKHLDKASVAVLDKEGACVLEVVQGKADAFLYDQMSVFSHWRRNADSTRAVLAPFQTEAWAIGVRKGADDLRKKVDAILEDIRQEGGYDQLGDRWLAEQKAEFKKLGIPFLF